MAKNQKSYTPEFKQQIVDLHNQAGKGITELSNEYGIPKGTISTWVKALSLHGVGTTLGPQLIAEIGDIRRFHNRKALIAYAGIDSSPYQSGTIDIKSRGISKRGSDMLRRTLLQVMDCILRHKHTGEPVYQFLDKKRAEGKHYYCLHDCGMQ